MNVNGHQDFINKFGNDNIAAFNNLKNCIAVCNGICNCQKQRKAIKVEECNKIYVNLVNTVVSNMIDYLRTKTTDDIIVFCEVGNHEIKRIKLR
jgi:hypothetical protein